MAARLGVVFLLFDSLMTVVASFLPEDGLVNALMGLANAHPQLLLLPWISAAPVAFPFPLCSSADDDNQYEDEEEEDDDDVIMKPPNMPPHFTLSFIADDDEAAPTAEDFGLPSLWDSTRLRVQSPNPVEILSKKSPEKLRLPQPTDLDLETLRSNDDAAEAVASLLGLSSSSTTTMPPFLDNDEPKLFSFGFTFTTALEDEGPPIVVAVETVTAGGAIEATLSGFLELWVLEER